MKIYTVLELMPIIWQTEEPEELNVIIDIVNDNLKRYTINELKFIKNMITGQGIIITAIIASKSGL